MLVSVKKKNDEIHLSIDNKKSNKTERKENDNSCRRKKDRRGGSLSKVNAIIKVIGVKDNRVTIGIEAPSDVVIDYVKSNSKSSLPKRKPASNK